MKNSLPPQIIIDETVEQLLTERYKPSAQWLEDALKDKRRAGRRYFNPTPAEKWVLASSEQARRVRQKDRIDSDEYIRTIHKLLGTRTEAERAERSSASVSESKRPGESAELRSLKEKVCFLEAQLESQRPFLQLYR